MEQGRVIYNGKLHQALVSPESPLSSIDNAASVLEGTVSKQEKDVDISTVHTVNGNQFQVPGLMSLGKTCALNRVCQ